MADYANLCQSAHADKEKMLEKWAKRGSWTDKEKLDYVALSLLCMESLNEDKWKRFHTEVYGAAYPADMMADDDTIQAWVHGMKNVGGTTGAHWTMEQTSDVVAKHGALTGNKVQDWAALNMVWSDYNAVAKSNNVDTVKFYYDMAKAFCDDADAPTDKLARYVWAMTQG